LGGVVPGVSAKPVVRTRRHAETIVPSHGSVHSGS
jgi:hypothetical protein